MPRQPPDERVARSGAGIGGAPSRPIVPHVGRAPPAPSMRRHPVAHPTRTVRDGLAARAPKQHNHRHAPMGATTGFGALAAGGGRIPEGIAGGRDVASSPREVVDAARCRSLAACCPLDPSRIGRDVIAGATLAALAIPEVMGYTKIAGMPVITGLYTILLPIVVVRDPRLVAPPRRRRGLGDRGDPGDRPRRRLGAVAGSPQYVELASLAALMCAVAADRWRASSSSGFIANFLSRSVLIGFLTGVGIQVAMGQVGGMFGVTEPGRRHDREVRRDAAAHPDRDQRRRPWPSRCRCWS